MNTAKRRILRAGIVLTGVAAGILFVAAGTYAQQHTDRGAGNPQQGTVVERQAAEGLDTIYAKELPSVQETLARAIQHLEAGHQQEALKDLRLAQSALETVRQALGKHVEPAIVNDRCPIMGSKINADKVPANLTRMYNGQKVAFCCAGCPSTWDQLDDAQKAAKLASVTVGPPKGAVPLKKAPTQSQQGAPSCCG